MSEVQGGPVVVGDARLAVHDVGAGPPVVLLHGIPTGSTLWRDVAAQLAESGHRVLAPDLPGYGATRLPPHGDYSLAGAAELVARWLASAGVGRAWVVGHDAGGAVAQLLAVRHPALLSRLTLTNSIVDGSWPAPRARVAKAAARLRLVEVAARPPVVPNRWIRAVLRKAFTNPERADAADLDNVVWAKFASPEGRLELQRSLAALRPADTAAAARALPHLEPPCQLVWGMDDPFQPWEAAGARLAALLPGAAVTQLQGCGHLTPLDCPDRLVSAMVGWSAEVQT